MNPASSLKNEGGKGPQQTANHQAYERLSEDVEIQDFLEQKGTSVKDKVRSRTREEKETNKDTFLSWIWKMQTHLPNTE